MEKKEKGLFVKDLGLQEFFLHNISDYYYDKGGKYSIKVKYLKKALEYNPENYNVLVKLEDVVDKGALSIKSLDIQFFNKYKNDNLEE